MNIDRRIFFKTAGLIGASLAVGKSFGETNTENSEIEFRGILYDASRCVGCQECERACAKAHELPEPYDEVKVGVLRKTSEKQRCVVNLYNTSKGEAFVRNQCMHCNEPACAAACLTQACTKQRKVL
jgi:formate dehydrogenase iron-sulfur subunit